MKALAPLRVCGCEGRQVWGKAGEGGAGRAGRGGRKVWVARQEGGGIGAREGSGCEAGQALRDNGTPRKKTEGPLHSQVNPARAHPPTHQSPRGQCGQTDPRALCTGIQCRTPHAALSRLLSRLPSRHAQATPSAAFQRAEAAFCTRSCLTARGVAAARQQKRAPAPAARAVFGERIPVCAAQGGHAQWRRRRRRGRSWRSLPLCRLEQRNQY